MEWIRSGQPRPYADSVNEFLLTFTGGTPSSTPGQELAHATMPPYASMARPGVIIKSYPERTEEERERLHYYHVKKIANALALHHGWDVDETAGERRRMGQSWLKEFEHVEGDGFSNTYRFLIIDPFMD
jgi:hypothetical protein